MRKLAIFIVRRRWWVIIATLIALPLAAILGGGVHDRLTGGGFEDPSAESARARAEINAAFPQAALSDFVLVVTVKDGTVDDAAVTKAATALTKELAHKPGVVAANSYWTYGKVAQLRSTDERQALVVAALSGKEDAKFKRAGQLAEELTAQVESDHDPFTILPTGEAVLTDQISKQAEKDLQKSELITAPITAIALVIVFGSIVAAVLPLGVGAIAVLGTFLLLTILTLLTPVSVFALNLTTALGLGLAIDYSLFMVSRYREELARGVSTNVAVGRSMQTAGRTVAFSAGTVMISLAALAVFDVPYLRSFAYAGVAVVLLAALAAVVVLPAVLAALGPRIEKGRIFKPKPESETGGFWGAQARRVMKHPVPYALGVSALLVMLAVPFFHVNLGLTDDRVVPDSVSGRRAVDQIRNCFTSRESNAIAVSLPDANLATDAAAIKRLAGEFVRLHGVAHVDSGLGIFVKGDLVPKETGPQACGTTKAEALDDHAKINFAPIALAPTQKPRFVNQPGSHGTYITVTPAIEPMSPAGDHLVRSMRATHSTLRFHVAGLGARLIDTKESVLGRLPLAIGLVAFATFILLFLMTGSLLVPLKALGLNVLSLTATFGAMVFIFQDGHFKGLLGFTPTGSVDVFTPILMFCISFGLSMDYEVFLLSRIKEEYDLDRNNEHAVAVGLQKTGKIVTAAALLLTIVFVGIATSEVAIVKLFGIGLTLAVLVDAFLIRATLVPAFMRLAGRSNWWAPAWLRRWHLRYGIWENEPIAILDREFESVP
ncbi:MAG: MMPL family transporter [Acidimicrobiia bacterium]